MRTANAVVTVTVSSTTSNTGDMSASFNSDPFAVIRMDQCALTATVSSASTLTGTLTVECCNDEGNNATGDASGVSGLTNWVTIANTSQAITGNGSTTWNLSNMGYRWVRVAWTRSGGSGTLAIRANAKGHD